jgi:hypothetical protein
MNIIQKLTNILLGLVIILVGNIYVTSRVVAPSKIISAANKAEINKGLADFIPKKLQEINKENPNSENAEFSASVNSLLTDEYIKQKSQKVLTDFDELFSGKREKVVIDFKDLDAEAKARGIDINFSDMKPVEVTSDQIKVQKEVSKQSNLVQIVGFALASLLFILSLIFAVVNRNFKTLSITLLTCGILFSLTSLSVFLLANILPAKIQLSGSAEVLSPYLAKVLATLGNEAATIYGFFTLVLVVLSAIFYIFHKILFKKPDPHSVPPETENKVEEKSAISSEEGESKTDA